MIANETKYLFKQKKGLPEENSGLLCSRFLYQRWDQMETYICWKKRRPNINTEIQTFILYICILYICYFIHLLLSLNSFFKSSNKLILKSKLNFHFFTNLFINQSYRQKINIKTNIVIFTKSCVTYFTPLMNFFYLWGFWICCLSYTTGNLVEYSQF